ncbi:hypothetical protein ES705_48857 [subsurface metagenome]
MKYNKSYVIFTAYPGHYGYNFQEQFITSLPEEILYKRSFLILKKLVGDMKSDIARLNPIILYNTISWGQGHLNDTLPEERAAELKSII